MQPSTDNIGAVNYITPNILAKSAKVFSKDRKFRNFNSRMKSAIHIVLTIEEMQNNILEFAENKNTIYRDFDNESALLNRREIK